MANFFIRTSKGSGKASLWFRIQRRSLNLDLWINSKIRVDVEQWNKAQRSSVNLQAYNKTPEGKAVTDKMAEVEQAVDLAIQSGKRSKAELQQAISTVVNADALKQMAEVEKIEKERKQAQAEEEAKAGHKIHNYYDWFIAGIKDGTILQKGKGREGKRYTSGTIRVWCDLGKYLKEGVPENMTFEDVTPLFADVFTAMLRNKGLSATTVNKYLINMKALCESAARNGVNPNLVSVKVWGKSVVDDDAKRAEIALTDAEANAIYEMPLNGLLEQVRDVWMLGYLTAQRVSDFTRLSRDNFKLAPDGTEVIVIRQQKTGAQVVIPITDERINDICLKYNYEFPQLDKRTINRYIKTICRDLSAQVPSLGEQVPTILSMAEQSKEQWFLSAQESVKNGGHLKAEDAKRYRRMCEYWEEHGSPEGMLYRRDSEGRVWQNRWECVTCHTARRSQITSLYENKQLYDITDKDIMSLSGHSELRNFERYIKHGEIDTAMKIAEKIKKAKEQKKQKKQS